MRQRRLPNLAVLRAFEATVRYGSVSKAAKSLNVTDGAVSRAVREFEQTLGFALFQRTSRMVHPTPQAQELASEIGRGLDNLQSAIDRACRHHQNRPLVISCEPTFLIRWLIPRLAGLQQAVGKERDLQLVSAGGAVAFSREGIDLAIRRNDFPIADDVVARPFLKERVGPVCRR
ncbi:MAG: LysR family transcriptional regulator, partial [Serratia marcescens]|nr:LysR family transcriptional regulator [Serratia marcescens]